MNNLTSFLGKVINFKMAGMEDAVSSAFSGYETSGGKTAADDNARKMWMDVVQKIAKIVDQFLPVAMIVLGLVAVVYFIVLGAKYSSSESEDTKNETKRKMINAVVGFAIGLVIMILMFVFMRNVPAIANWINGKDDSGNAWYELTSNK